MGDVKSNIAQNEENAFVQSAHTFSTFFCLYVHTEYLLPSTTTLLFFLFQEQMKFMMALITIYQEFIPPQENWKRQKIMLMF